MKKAIIGIVIIFLLSFQLCAAESWLHIKEINFVQLKCVRSIAIGNDGSVWIGSDTGLFRYHEGGGEHLLSKYVSCVEVDSEGAVWVSQSGKLLKYHDGTWETIWDTYIPGSDSSHVDTLYSLSFAPDGSLWADSSDKGLYKFDGKTWTLYTVENGLYDNFTSFVMVDPEGTVWCRYGETFYCEGDPYTGGPGTCIFGGVSCFDGIQWKTYNNENGLIRNDVNDIIVSPNGSIIVSYGGFRENKNGLSLFNGKTWETLTTEYVGDILTYGPDGVLWTIGFFGGPLHSYSNGIWTVHEGMPEVVQVNSIMVDKKGTVWLGTGQGIICYTPTGTLVEDEIHGQTETKIISNSPNPFNISTTIAFFLPKPEQVKLEVYSITGQKVAVLVDNRMNAGRYSVVFDGSNLASGIYFFRFTAGGFDKKGKIILVK